MSQSFYNWKAELQSIQSIQGSGAKNITHLFNGEIIIKIPGLSLNLDERFNKASETKVQLKEENQKKISYSIKNNVLFRI